ncbi:MAG: hypothetical protein RLZZ244_244 [Verrucomicrobiota bacterium]
MKALRPLLPLLVLPLLSSCSVNRPAPYHVKAYKPHNPDAVRVKVSLSTQNLYVLEGDRLLMAAATCVGTPEKPTPKGHFKIYQKISDKRSMSYGFFVNGGEIVPGESAKPKPGRFVGHPMGFWCEFAPAYGIHTGYVHPVPRTHGCLRLHKDVAPKFYALVKIGTPVSIADSLPEDATHGKAVVRPTDYKDPDPEPEFMISAKAFERPAGPLLLEQP